MLDYEIKINTFLSFKAFDNTDTEWMRMRVKIINKMNDGIFVKKIAFRWNSQLKHYY